MDSKPVKLTQYSHGAGCGCKISPKVLDEILKTNTAFPDHNKLVVGNHSKDDAAVYDLGNGQALISTTDFFMPIVDDAFDFGKIAAANAISDVYAMGGTPLLAVAILGWPVNVLSAAIARRVIEGGRAICKEAGIPLAGGHSIDSPEPIFGLAVNGLINKEQVKKNNEAKAGNLLYLTKSLGVGILTTAEKKNILKPEHVTVASKQMMQLNKIGEALGKEEGVSAMTDVTGFGLLGHLVEMSEGSGVSAEVYFEKLPMIVNDLGWYISRKAVPGGTSRNWDSYGEYIAGADDYKKAILADPQTSGGLLVAVNTDARERIEKIFSDFGLLEHASPVGKIVKQQAALITVV